MDNLSDIVKQRSDYKQSRESKYKLDSKDRLSKILKKKIQTTMIGALSTIEEHFGFLWGHGTEEQLTPEQQHLRDLYDEVRSEILDRGNAQSRNLEAEFANYDVSWNRYKMELPVKKLDETNSEFLVMDATDMNQAKGLEATVKIDCEKCHGKEGVWWSLMELALIGFGRMMTRNVMLNWS